MEFLVLLGAALLLWLIFAPLVALSRAKRALADAQAADAKAWRENLVLSRRIDAIETRLAAAKSPTPKTRNDDTDAYDLDSVHTENRPGAPASVAGAVSAGPAQPPAASPPPSLETLGATLAAARLESGTGVPPVSSATPVSAHGQDARATKGTAPPPLPAFVPPALPAPSLPTSPVSHLQSPVSASPVPEPAAPAFDWEQFMGAKLFAWLGGLALFLSAAYGIKYSFDHALIPPALRAAFGLIAGLALIIGGLRLNREKYSVTQQSLAATGTVILYAVTFACSSHSLWNLIPTGVAFALMSVITGAAFLIAVRLEARVVAVLGIAGGFLTPILLSTGEDNPFGLFGYIALLNAGLLAVALRKRWHFLAGLGALGTVLMQLGWWINFYFGHFDSTSGMRLGGYAGSEKIYIPMAIFLGMTALFTGAAYLAKRREQTSAWFSCSGLALGASAMIAAVPFLDAPFFHDTPAIPFAYAFLGEALAFALAASDKRIRWAGPLAGSFVFLLLGGWTIGCLTEANLNTALALYMTFAVLHTAVPLTLKRLGKISATPGWCHAFPVFALLLALIPAFRFDSLLVWPLLLLVDVLAVVLAVAGAILWPLLLVLAITVLAAVGAMLHIGQDLSGLNSWLLVLGGVSVAFIGLGVWLWKKFTPKEFTVGDPLGVTGNAAIATMIPPISAGLPFLLLIMATLRLPLADPSSVFGLALLLSVLLLGLGKLLRIGALAPVGLAGVALLEFTWHANHFSASAGNAGLALGWHLGFAALYFAYPFVFHRDFANKVAPWIAAVASLGVHFLLFHHTVMVAWPHAYPAGLNPLLFALPAFAGLALVLKRTPQDSPARLAQLALFGGAALAFITAVFPLQFKNQWLTLAWAFEGAALLWLFRRVPHNGLRLAAFALLAAAFTRLALNPAILSYHERGDLPIWNWYLYTYGLAALAFSLAARLLKAPANLICGLDGCGLLRAASAVLGFLLLNIEIADFFSKPGAPVLTFDFSNNLPRDMSYTIAWALFSLGMLITGIVKRERTPRYAAIALLAVTLGKLFLHDLANLDQLYRIGALMAVAIIAIASSFLYQKFLSEEKK